MDKQEQIISEWAMNRSCDEICNMLRLVRESARQWLSRFLMDTNEIKRHECYIVLDTPDDCGLSSLEKPTIVSMYQEPGEGIIWFEFDYYDGCVDFDQIDTDSIIQIIKELED